MTVSEFEREDRYAVIKYKKLTAQQWTLVPELLEKFDKARVDCVVVEKDWPEYNFVWLMLEHRMAGYPVPDFNAVKCAADVQAAQSELTALKAELASEEQGHAELRDVVAALREELAGYKHDIASFLETTAKVCNLLGIDTEDAKNYDGKPSDVLFSHAEALRQRLTAAEQRNAFLEAQVSAKDIGIDFRDALISAVSMSEDTALMAWVPSEWEAKRRTLFSNATPTEFGASE